MYAERESNSLEKTHDDFPNDMEKARSLDLVSDESRQSPDLPALSRDDSGTSVSWLKKASSALAKANVEVHGLSPVKQEDQTFTNISDMFTLWFGTNAVIITFSTGTLGPLLFGLSLRDSALTILFINMLGLLLPAYFSTFGPLTGLRQMIVARYSFGWIGSSLLAAVNCITFMGFSILNAIIGGQSLASASSGNLSWNVGIVIVVLVSLALTFMGYRVLNVYEKYAWIPVVIIFIIITGIAGGDLQNPAPVAPATASTVLTFAASLAGFVISWSLLSADYTLYCAPNTNKTKLFVYTYLGYLIPTVLLEVLGAAFMGTAFVNKDWMDGYEAYGVGGLIAASLSSVGKFGSFCMVVLAFSVVSAIAPTMYSCCISFQCIAPIFTKVPRYLFSILATAILIPLSIVGAKHFELALQNFLSIIGYYVSPYAAVVLIEHLCFRRGSGSSYDRTAWNSLRRLPTGWAGIVTIVTSFGLIVPSMDTVWFVGPFAKWGTGDIGFEVGFAYAAIAYYVLRTIDLKFVGKRLGGTEEDL